MLVGLVTKGVKVAPVLVAFQSGLSQLQAAAARDFEQQEIWHIWLRSTNLFGFLCVPLFVLLCLIKFKVSQRLCYEKLAILNQEFCKYGDSQELILDSWQVASSG